MDYKFHDFDDQTQKTVYVDTFKHDISVHLHNDFLNVLIDNTPVEGVISAKLNRKFGDKDFVELRVVLSKFEQRAPALKVLLGL